MSARREKQKKGGRGGGKRARSGGGADAKSGSIRIQLTRSPIGSTSRQRAVLAGLGLRRLNQIVERPDRPETRGMVAKVPHLVRVVS